MAIKSLVLTSTVACVFAAGVVGAQSLGDVAKKEGERRKAVQTSGKTYTNDNLRIEPAPQAPATVAPAAQASGASSSPDAASQAGAKDATKDGAKDAAAGKADTAKDEASWKKRVADARTALDRSKSFADALQSRINALTADFAARSDPAQRAAIGADRQKALDELTRVNKEIQDGTKAIADIQDDARKAGVPAGWVR